MVVDARDLESREIFLRLREILSANCGRDVDLEVMLRTYVDSKRVRAFIGMSGCRTEIEKKEGHYVVRISGNICCA